MAKSIQKMEARQMRKNGKSIKEIAIKLQVSKSSASVWCSDIILSSKQINDLNKKMVIGGYRGRMIGSRM